MNKYLSEAILSIMAISSLTFLSCGGDDNDIENPMPKLVENLPSAENVKSTSAYIPVYDKGSIELVLGGNEQFNLEGVLYYHSFLPMDSCGFLLTGLEPDSTYYYTMVYHYGYESIWSKQVKSFTTKGVSIEFIDPTIISMGNWERKALRVKTHGVEEWDVPYNLNVIVYWTQDGSAGRSISYPTYLGDGIWQLDSWPSEGEHCQAVIQCWGGYRTVAKTPIVTLSNGLLVEE